MKIILFLWTRSAKMRQNDKKGWVKSMISMRHLQLAWKSLQIIKSPKKLQSLEVFHRYLCFIWSHRKKPKSTNIWRLSRRVLRDALKLRKRAHQAIPKPRRMINKRFLKNKFLNSRNMRQTTSLQQTSLLQMKILSRKEEAKLLSTVMVRLVTKLSKTWKDQRAWRD